MDPIANFLTRLRNAYKAGLPEVEARHSKIKEGIAKLLEKNGYVGKVTIEGEVPHKVLKVKLRYSDHLPILTHIKRISKPSVRYYTTKDKIPYALSGKGLTILSTSQGLMTSKDARRKGIGGEIICQIW